MSDVGGLRVQEVMNRLHTRENSTLLFATVASSASFILLGALKLGESITLNSQTVAIAIAGFVLPVLGSAYRELTILGIDNADFWYLNLQIGRTEYPLRVTRLNDVRRFTIRFLLLIPSVLWFLVMTGFNGVVAILSVLVVALLIILLGMEENKLKNCPSRERMEFVPVLSSDCEKHSE